MTAVHLLAYAASKFVASRAERKAKELERAQSQKISTIGTYGDSPEFVVFDPKIHDSNLFNAKQTAVGLGTGNQSISNLPVPKPVDPQDKFHTAYIHPDVPSQEPMTLRGWQSWAQTNIDGPFQTMDSQGESDFDFMQEFNSALRPVGQLNGKDGSFTPKEMGTKKETTSTTRKPKEEVAGFYIRGGGFFESYKKAEVQLEKMRDAGDAGPELKIEKKTQIEYDDGTFSFETFTDIAGAADAANNAKKGTPLFSLTFNTITKGGESETPEPIKIYAETGVNDNRVLDQLSNVVGERFAGLKRNQILKQVDTDSYRSFVTGVARTIIRASTKPINVDGVQVASPDLFLQDDPRQFVSANYRTLATLPGLFEAVEQAIGDMEFEPLQLKIEENDAKGETTIVTQTPTQNGDTVHLATGVNKGDLNAADYSGTGSLDMLGQRLLSNKVDKKKVDKFIQETVVDYVRSADGSMVRAKDQPKIAFINDLFTKKVDGTGRLYYDVLQDVFSNRDRTTYSDVEQIVLEDFMSQYGDIDDKVMFMINTSKQFSGQERSKKNIQITNCLKSRQLRRTRS